MAKLLCLALCLALVAGASAHWEINWPVYPVTGAADVITPIR